ncbi:MAG: hypothetical protein AAF840_17635, partial [Bacteroidota bacterium]
AGTFDAKPARQLTQRCRGKQENPVCAEVRYYESRADKMNVCQCAPGSWPAQIMKRAIEQMQRAVDAGGSERSCRMLRRQWLALRG